MGEEKACKCVCIYENMREKETEENKILYNVKKYN